MATIATITHDQFIVGGDYLTKRKSLAATTSVVPAHTVLGKVTATGLLKPWAPAGETPDGSEIPYGILVRDAAIGTDEQTVSVYIKGTFNADGINLPSGSTAEDVYDGLRAVGIYLFDQVDKNRHAVEERT